MRRTVAISSAALLVVVVAFSVFLGTRHAVNDATSVTSPLLGKVAPNFSGEELKTNTSSGTFSLSKYRGDIVVINFWASWCVPCQTESPNISNAGHGCVSTFPFGQVAVAHAPFQYVQAPSTACGASR